MEEEKSEKLQELKTQIKEFEKTVKYYQKLFLEDGGIDTDEQKQLDKLSSSISVINKKIETLENESGVKFDFSKQKSGISIAATDDIATQFMPDDEPIEKGLAYWVTFSLDTFVTVQNQDAKKSIKYEFKKEEQMEISLKAGTDYHIYAWSTAYIDYYSGLFANFHKKESITKKMYYQISISPNGKLDMEKISEKVSEASSPDVIDEYSVKLFSEPKESAALILIKGSATTPEKDDDGVKNEKQVLSETETNVHFNITDIKEIPKVHLTQELFFEKENQKELSNDQFVVLEKWWGSLGEEVIKNIKNNTLEITIKGYTTHTGENKDNFILAKDRAKNVKEFLDGMIGEGRNKIIIEAVGEREKSKRYAEIIVKSR
jgi:hypothetical protein